MHFGILCRNIGLSAGFGPLAQCEVNVVGLWVHPLDLGHLW